MSDINTEEVNYMVLGAFLLMALPTVLESLVETGQEMTVTAIVTELNKMQSQFVFDNKFVSIFIENLTSNTQSFAMAKIFSGFLLLNNVINKEHFTLLKGWGMLKGVLGNLSTKLAKGKFKKLLSQGQTDNALVVQGSISNRLQTWGSSAHMTNAYATGGSLHSMAKTSKINNLKNRTDVGKAINGLYNVSGFGKVVKNETI